MVPALGGMDMRLRRWRGELTWQHNPSSLGLLAKMLGDVRVEGLDVPDQPMQETARLELAAGELRYEAQQPVQDIGSRMAVHDLLWLLFDKRVIFFFEVFRKNRHGGGRDMEGAQRPPQ